MAEYVHLIGAENVERGASRIAGAADDMQRAVNQLDNALERHRAWADEWLSRFEDIVVNRAQRPG